jgi:hypothetical protein
MRIVHVVDAAQAQAQVQQRFIPPPTLSPPRRIPAVSRQAGPDDPFGVGTAPPDDAVSLSLSPEGREAARQAAIEELLASQAPRQEPALEGEPEPTAGYPSEKTKEDQVIAELERRDRQVRAHEQAHAAAAGGLGSAPTYTYQVGPDGRSYAVGGEVKIDTSPVVGDPEATLRKARQIERAALVSGGDASPEDLRAAVMAAAMAAHARQELARQQEDDRHGRAETPEHRVNRSG